MSENIAAADSRAAFLKEVEKIVCKDRSATHGSPEQNFENIASMWSTFKGVKFTAKDVAAMMVLVKLSRIIHNPDHRDSWIDIAGYAACTASLGTILKVEKPSETNPKTLNCFVCNNPLGVEYEVVNGLGVHHRCSPVLNVGQFHSHSQV